MKHLALLLIFCPTLGAADGLVRPGSFDYGATFDKCVSDPSATDLASQCIGWMSEAYLLKRAVAVATQACLGQDLASCALPFEDQGLPAIAASIAAGAGCENSDLTLLQNGKLPQAHCAGLIADILLDEGVVPVDNQLSCRDATSECLDLARLHAAFWTNAVDAMALGNPTISDLQGRNADTCQSDDANEEGWQAELAALNCLADRTAVLWGDLTTTE